MNVLWIFLVFYLEIAFFTIYIIYYHHSKKDNPWLISKYFNLQRSRVIYLLCWITLLISTLVLYYLINPNSQ